MPVVDQETGEVVKMQVFVAVLGASGYAFVYAVPTQKIADWLECHTKAFAFFGGVPRQLIPDNLKSAMTKNTRDELIVNRCYWEQADHYQWPPPLSPPVADAR
jgi:transposase